MKLKCIFIFSAFLSLSFSGCEEKKSSSPGPSNGTSPSSSAPLTAANLRSSQIIGIIYSEEPPVTNDEVKSSSFTSRLTELVTNFSTEKSKLDNFLAQENIIEATFTEKDSIILCSCKNPDDNNYYLKEIQANSDNEYIFPSGKYISTDLELFDKNKNNISKKQLNSIESSSLNDVKNPMFNILLAAITAKNEPSSAPVNGATPTAAVDKQTLLKNMGVTENVP